MGGQRGESQSLERRLLRVDRDRGGFEEGRSYCSSPPLSPFLLRVTLSVSFFFKGVQQLRVLLDLERPALASLFGSERRREDRQPETVRQPGFPSDRTKRTRAPSLCSLSFFVERNAN